MHVVVKYKSIPLYAFVEGTFIILSSIERIGLMFDQAIKVIRDRAEKESCTITSVSIY